MDQGSFFVDQNTARFAKYPAEPLFRSLAIMQPDLSMQGFDLVTDRNCLRKLLRFVSSEVDRSFRIDIQIQGEVMFLRRWEEELKHVILSHEHFGFGHNFEEATTSFDKGLKDSSGHHRVTRYNLGSIRCLVRYEADGCTETDQDLGDKAKVIEKVEDADDLAGALESMSIAKTRAQNKGSVQVLEKGRTVSPETIMEIKTRSTKRKLKLDEVLPQLWFAQTPNLVIGYHTSGRFEEIQKLSMKDEFERWEKEHQVQLKKLVGLLKRLKEVTQKTKNQRCVVVCEQQSSGSLNVYESTKTSAVLPDDILAMHQWDDKVNGVNYVDEVDEVKEGEKAKEVEEVKEVKSATAKNV